MSNENEEPIFEFKNHWDESDEFYWDFVCDVINHIFPEAIYSMRADSFGWGRKMPCRIIEGNGEKLLTLPFNVDATFRIYKREAHWEVKIFHHDSPMGDLFSIHKHKTEDEAAEFLRGLGHRI